jgi:DNA mismatch endonuclease (patch repair protein)
MSRIRSRGNMDTEVALVKFFRRNKITGWRRNQKIFGKPDFVFPKIRLALFVDGRNATSDCCRLKIDFGHGMCLIKAERR